jgi:hypothetical protein
MDARRRYRLAAATRLGWRLHTGRIEEGRKNLEVSLAERMTRGRQGNRQACWTESLVLGGPAFVEKVQPLILSRLDTEIVATRETIWSLPEGAALPYGRKMGTKIAAKAHHGSLLLHILLQLSPVFRRQSLPRFLKSR